MSRDATRGLWHMFGKASIEAALDLEYVTYRVPVLPSLATACYTAIEKVA
jgi:hypothetical protein